MRSPTALRVGKRGCNPGRGRCGENDPQRQLGLQRVANARDQLRGEQRVATAGEEVIVYTDAALAEHFGKQRAERVLRAACGHRPATDRKLRPPSAAPAMPPGRSCRSDSAAGLGSVTKTFGTR
jgi:hypothetical protein